MDIETAHNKLEYNFSSSGALLTIKDLHDLALTFAYSGGLLSTVTEPGGNVYSFAYSGGQASTITRLGNLTTTLTVDGSGDLTVIENADGGLRSFVYDPSRL